MSLIIQRAGLFTTVQDLGRLGLQRYGIVVSGAMDTMALRIGNLLVGNDESAAALEMTLKGPTIWFNEDTIIAITGAELSPTIDNLRVPSMRPVFVKRGSVLQFGSCKKGCRGYLTVAGGIDVPLVMGCRSTYVRGGIGGHHGRTLIEGDELFTGRKNDEAARRIDRLANRAGEKQFAATSWAVNFDIQEQYKNPPTIRVLKGTHFDAFTEKSQLDFFHKSYQISPQSDRMGYRLEGPTMKLTNPLELISEAVVRGTVQVPPEGQPIILLSDRQTTGGYPRIAQIATVDIPLFAQLKPGDKVKFKLITIEKAQQMYLDNEQRIQDLKLGFMLKIRKYFSTM